MFQQNAPKSYWGEVVLTSSYVINRIHSRVLGYKSPLETLSQFYRDTLSSFNLAPRVFWCTSFVNIPNHNRGKLDPRALKSIFVGYSSTQKGYKCSHLPTIGNFIFKLMLPLLIISHTSPLLISRGSYLYLKMRSQPYDH